jgi:predicted PurR-regulated permease PerM
LGCDSTSCPQKKKEFHKAVTDEKLKLPLFTKTSIFVIGLVALFTILYIAKGIILPVVFSIIIAIVLHPVVNFFVGKKINRVLAIVVTLFLTFLVIAAFGLLFFSQASRLGIMADTG